MNTRLFYFLGIFYCTFFAIRFTTALYEDYQFIFGKETTGVVSENKLLYSNYGAEQHELITITYQVNGISYEICTFAERLKVGDSVQVIYDRKKPSIAAYGPSAYELKKVLFITALDIFFIVITFFCVFLLIKIWYVIQNGNRILCEITECNSQWPPLFRIVKCKQTDNEVVFKGACGFMIEELMESNGVKYITVYIMLEKPKSYYVHCDELRKIIKRKNYNGYKIEDLM